MTRKDYILIAVALKEARNHWLIASETCDADSFREGLHAAALEIGGALARDNPRFDRERFLRAAGVADA